MQKSIETLPLRYALGEGVGRGKDSVVVALGKKATSTGLVVKWNHDYPSPQPETDVVLSQILYKKNKYEILKAFLGEFIPDSYFILGTKTDGSKAKSKELTIQKRVPDVRLGTLSDEQLRSPILRSNVGLLLGKLENMYLALGMINGRTGGGSANLDGKVDLGGMSDYARQYIEHGHGQAEVDTVLSSSDILRSPNICVDPETLDIFCIDFDKGEWTPEKEQAKMMLFEVLDRRPEMQHMAEMTPVQYQNLQSQIVA